MGLTLVVCVYLEQIVQRSKQIYIYSPLIERGKSRGDMFSAGQPIRVGERP